MREIILETERLLLRRMELSDYADLAQMLQDPRVMYAYEHDFTDADTRAWLERQIMRYEKYGFGLWAMALKQTNAMIGQAGLTMQPYGGAEVPEIGYLLKYDFWHMGYAREAAASCRDHAFYALSIDKVHSVIKTDNHASIRVAKAIGMKREAEFLARYYNGEVPHYLYSMKKQPGL